MEDSERRESEAFEQLYDELRQARAEMDQLLGGPAVGGSSGRTTKEFLARWGAAREREARAYEALLDFHGPWDQGSQP